MQGIGIARYMLGSCVCLSQSGVLSMLTMQLNVLSRNQQRTEVDTVEGCK